MRHIYIADTDTSVHCFDCGVLLDNDDSFEPVFRLDTVTGETTHGSICRDCVADLETVYEADVMRLACLYAHRYRTSRDISKGISALAVIPLRMTVGG